MRSMSLAYAASAVFVLTACREPDVVAPQQQLVFQPSQATELFATHLGGSTPQGQGLFQLGTDASSVGYQLVVANVEDVIDAHIHLGPLVSIGPIVIPLSPSISTAAVDAGGSAGRPIRGIFTADDLIGPLAGEPLSALLQAMRAGETYVDIHTSEHPEGEIRGQIRALGPR